jgi:hypothetical protein
MKLLIMQCTHSNFWYADLIGIEFDIVSESVRDYNVVHNGTIKSILKIDAVNI